MEPKEFWLKESEKFKKLKKVDEALECLEKVRFIDNASNKSYFWFQKGVRYCEIKEYEKALECFDKDLEFNELNFETLFQKGVTLYDMKNYVEAIECFNKAWEAKYSKFLQTKEQIQTLKDHKQFEKAMTHSSKLDEMESIPYQFWHYKGNSLMKIKKYPEASECFDEALSIKHDEPWVIFDKAKCEFLRGEENNSLLLLEKACDLDGDIKNIILKAYFLKV